MTDIRKYAWKPFVSSVRKFLGNRISKDFQELVERMLGKCPYLRTKMSFLKSYLKQILENLGHINDEEGLILSKRHKNCAETYQGRYEL